ncbi:MAG: ketoacyl-ACP synthase III [Phycisphaerae bacterium]|nr:ketoacyl-ACP synthase III [Phycisphaerae bacterium]
MDKKNSHLPGFTAAVIGSGSSAPSAQLTNEDLAAMVDTSDEWITTRTGIKKRHIAKNGETTASLASEAARKALESAGMKPEELELIIVGTITPEMVFPSTAAFVQDAIGAKNAWVFDLAAACSGFIYSLGIAQQFIETGQHKNALVIGAETLSKIVNWKDRASCILFGDGAGAVILKANNDEKGILRSRMGSDGSEWEVLNCQAYGSRNPSHKPLDDPNMIYMQINGRSVYQQAVRRIIETTEQCLADCGMGFGDIDLLVSHQMNARIIESAAKRLKLPDEKVFMNIAEYGNTSAASVPIALDEALRSGRIKSGDIVVLVAFGAGLTWGASVIRF